MIISELQAKLEEFKQEFGDIPVMFVDMESYTSMQTRTPGALPIKDTNIVFVLEDEDTSKPFRYVLIG